MTDRYIAETRNQTTHKYTTSVPNYERFVHKPAHAYARAAAITYGSVIVLIFLIAIFAAVLRYMIANPSASAFVAWGRMFEAIFAVWPALVFMVVAPFIVYYGTYASMVKQRAGAHDDLIAQPTEIMEQSVNSGPIQLMELDFTISTGGRVAHINQPEPGAFVAWLKAVIAPGRVQFSGNESATRGWEPRNFVSLMSELHYVGWLDRKEDGNGVYRLTDQGRILAQQWLDEQAGG